MKLFVLRRKEWAFVLVCMLLLLAVSIAQEILERRGINITIRDWLGSRNVIFRGAVLLAGVLLILCFAWGGDTAAYFAGRAFGRHKLAPIVSPHKTVEGAVGGVLGSMAAGCVLTLVYSLLSAKYNVISIQVQPKHYLVLLGMGAVASVLGILGDLFASSVKRQVGIKDYGTIFPGHGGILDRFDSVMFIAPFVCIAVRYFFYLL